MSTLTILNFHNIVGEESKEGANNEPQLFVHGNLFSKCGPYKKIRRLIANLHKVRKSDNEMSFTQEEKLNRHV